MNTLNIHEAKTRLSAVLREIEEGETYLICRNGKPVATLSPFKRKNRMDLHPVLSRIKINYDPTEYLTEEEWGEID